MGDEAIVRNLEPAEVRVALDWAAAEGWNPGLHDHDAFFAADPDGYFGLEVDGELAVTLSIVRYDERFAFMGFYICRPDLRGRGLGLELFETALTRCDAAVVGLDGVLEQEPNYARDGFVTAHHSVRFGGRPDVVVSRDDGIRVLDAGDVDALVAFEREHHVFPAPRRAFLERWIAAPGTTTYAVGDDGRIDGYGVVRPCRDGHKIGPLFGTDRTTAERLLAALLTQTDGHLVLDVPVPNADGSAMARDLGLEPVFETARMYRGPDPGLHLDRVFGITSFELG